MKIGEKEFTLKITNRVIINIEQAFNKSIGELVQSLATATTHDMCLFLWTSIKDRSDVTLDDFIDMAEPQQLIPAVTEVIQEITKAFGLDTKKK